MLTALTIAVILFCLLMGVTALATPERITRIHGTRELTADGRNEVRAVYGGFGVAMAIVLAWGLRAPALGPGIFLSVGGAFGGMALGRLVAATIERPRRFYPSWFYCVLELLVAATLWAAAAGGG
jgi:hypothetical protein